MRVTVLLFLTMMFLTHLAFCQNLEGTWRGNYIYNRGVVNYAIALKIESGSDSSIQVHTYTLLNYIKKDSVYKSDALIIVDKDSTYIIRELPVSGKNNELTQEFHLKYIRRNGFEYLEGKWGPGYEEYYNMGEVSFVKLKEENGISK